jgi:hypothetical protein
MLGGVDLSILAFDLGPSTTGLDLGLFFTWSCDLGLCPIRKSASVLEISVILGRICFLFSGGLDAVGQLVAFA